MLHNGSVVYTLNLCTPLLVLRPTSKLSPACKSWLFFVLGYADAKVPPHQTFQLHTKSNFSPTVT